MFPVAMVNECIMNELINLFPFAYVQAIAERKKWNDPSTNVQQKFNIEWDIRQLMEDVERDHLMY